MVIEFWEHYLGHLFHIQSELTVVVILLKDLVLSDEIRNTIRHMCYKSRIESVSLTTISST